VEAIDRWNERYRSGELGPAYPSPLLVEVADRLAPGQALDLACGAGRNALFLAQHGWSVVAIDGSAVAIDVVRSLDPRIDARVLDLEREPLDFEDDSFDLVCLINFLHRPLFAEARRLVRPGGAIITAIHTDRSTMNPPSPRASCVLISPAGRRSSIAKMRLRSWSRARRDFIPDTSP
jgi:SAM-dependent methyltransferase